MQGSANSLKRLIRLAATSSRSVISNARGSLYLKSTGCYLLLPHEVVDCRARCMDCGDIALRCEPFFDHINLFSRPS